MEEMVIQKEEVVDLPEDNSGFPTTDTPSEPEVLLEEEEVVPIVPIEETLPEEILIVPEPDPELV